MDMWGKKSMERRVAFMEIEGDVEEKLKPKDKVSIDFLNSSLPGT